jgi:hypothetical protein
MTKLSFHNMAAVAIFLASYSANAQILDPGDVATFDEPFAGRVDKEDCPVAGDCGAGWVGNEAQVFSVIILSVFDSGAVQSTLYTPFTVSGDKPRSIDARITGNASWRGEVVAPGIGGTEAKITITATLYDMTTNTIAGSTQVHQKVCEGSIISACRSEQIGDEDISFTATVIRGHNYELRLTAECVTRTGLVGADVICSFAPLEEDFGILNDGFIHWNGFTVTLEDDIVGLLEDLKTGQEDLKAGQEDLKAGQEDLKAGQEDLKAGQEDLKTGQDEIIHLLNTPQGQRPEFPYKNGN